MLSFSGHCHVIFPYMEPLSFFGRFVQKVTVPCFSDSFVQKTTQQSDGSCKVRSDSQVSYKLFNLFFISAKTYEKDFVNEEHCIARHNDKMCFLPNCRYHIILIGDIKQLLQKLDAFCSNYQHVDCLYTHFKYCFSGKLLSRLTNSLVMCRVHFNLSTKTEEWTECPASLKTDS